MKMKLWKYGGKFWSFDLWRWAFPIAIEINKFYLVKDTEKIDDKLLNDELYSIEFRFALLCFHVEFMIDLKDEDYKNEKN